MVPEVLVQGQLDASLWVWDKQTIITGMWQRLHIPTPTKKQKMDSGVGSILMGLPPPTFAPSGPPACCVLLSTSRVVFLTDMRRTCFSNLLCGSKSDQAVNQDWPSQWNNCPAYKQNVLAKVLQFQDCPHTHVWSLPWDARPSLHINSYKICLNVMSAYTK